MEGIKMATHKVAVIRFIGQYTSYDDYNDNIVNSITQWEEVSDEEFNLLVDSCNYATAKISGFEYRVVEQLSIDSKTVIRNIREYVQHIEAQRKAEQIAKDARAEKARERQMKKLAKDKEARRLLLEQLQQEFVNESV